MPRNMFNAEMDQLLMDQIILSNPFKYGVTWDMILENLLKSGDAALFQGITKSYTVRGRALLIMGKRRALVAKQLTSSGLEEPPCTDLDLALDEAIQLEDDSKVSQRMNQEERRERENKCKHLQQRKFSKLLSQAETQKQDAEEAAPLEADQEGSRKAGPLADGPRVKRRKSDLMKVMDMQEARSEARQATLLENQARWRQVESTDKMEWVKQQMTFRVKELELQRDRLDMEKKHREEEKKQREEEKKQREEEKKQREEEKKQREEEEKKQREEEKKQREEEKKQREEEKKQREEEEKKQREEEEKKQREEEKKYREEEMRLRGEEIRLRGEEIRQRGEENRIRSLESQNQRDALMKMLELLASKK